MNSMKDSFCSYCGTRYLATAYPRTCQNESCKVSIWSNPVPVSVVLQPVMLKGELGLLVIRRAIEPRIGKLALVGGFVEDHETVEQAGAREMREESSVQVDSSSLTPFWFTSSAPKPNRVLLFLEGQTLEADALPPLQPTPETAERGLIFGAEGLAPEFAFPLHLEAVRRFFVSHANLGPHGYRQI